MAARLAGRAAVCAAACTAASTAARAAGCRAGGTSARHFALDCQLLATKRGRFWIFVDLQLTTKKGLLQSSRLNMGVQKTSFLYKRAKLRDLKSS
jgi:hypothetical protein